jgi:hypothetical protein
MKLNMDLFLDKMELQPNTVHKLKEIDPKAMHQAATWVIQHNCSVYPGIFAPGAVLDDLLPEKPWLHCQRDARQALMSFSVRTTMKEQCLLLEKCSRITGRRSKQC